MNSNKPATTGSVREANRAAELQWSPYSDPNDSCHYNHTFAETPFGRFLLTWKSWKDNPGYGFDETPWGEVVYLGWDTVDSAKQWAKEELIRRAQLCLPAYRAAVEKALAAWDAHDINCESGVRRFQAAMAELRAVHDQGK